MLIDELEAFQLARKRASAISGTSFWIHLKDNVWHVLLGIDVATFVDAQSGQLIEKFFDSHVAFSLARDYAKTHALRWQPAFHLELQPRYWKIGACQDRLGGQVTIEVSHSGVVLRHDVNPK